MTDCGTVSREDIEEAFSKCDSIGTGFIRIKRLKVTQIGGDPNRRLRIKCIATATHSSYN